MIKKEQKLIRIGKKLSLFELIYIKKEDRKDFEMVDFDYIKNVALFAKHCGAKSVALVSAIGANNKSSNIYLNVKGKIEKEIMSLGFKKVVIAQPSHLLGKRPDEQTNYLRLKKLIFMVRQLIYLIEKKIHVLFFVQ